MKKFLDILLIFSLSLLIFSLFFNNKKVPENTLELSFEKNAYTIPASVKLLVKNYTSSWVVLNNCDDISIFKSWEKMTFDKSFCKDIEVWSGKTLPIDYSVEYKLFDKIGKYSMEANVEWKKYLDQFELDNKWIIKKTFVWLIYKDFYL